MNSETLFLENQRLVGFALKRLGIRPDDNMHEDYQQAGYIGLLKAARKFKPELGYKFSSYAMPMIMGEIMRERRDHGGILHIPRTLKYIYYRYRQLDERDYTDEEICEELNISISQLNELKGAYAPLASLDEPHPRQKNNSNKIITIGDTVPSSLNLEEDCVSNIYWERIFDRLTEEERMCIRLRSRELSQHQIAKKVGISQIQVSRILRKVKKRMKRLKAI